MTQPSVEPVSPPLSLGDFLDRVRSTNPFLVNRVDRPLANDWVDVADIHDAEFRRVVALGREAQAENRGVGVVVWGEAGVGKSHLLSRLGRWARASQEACFVYLHNLQASPERLPRFVLRSVLHFLGAGRKPPWSRTPLFRLLNQVLKTALQPNPNAPPTWGQIWSCYSRLVDGLAERDPSLGVLFDRTIYDILFRFFYAAYPSVKSQDYKTAKLALRWLSGEVLSAEDAAHLGAPVAVHDNQHVKQVLVALAEVARLAGQLLLLCFDQVDNLDEEQIQALSRFLHDLLDSSGNLLVVTTGVHQTMLAYLRRGVITKTSWDRLGQFEVSLGRLSRPGGRELLEARLQKFLEPHQAVREVEESIRQDALFPLGNDWFETRVRELPDFRPRDLLTWAGERWQEQQQALGRQDADWLQSWRSRPTAEPGREGSLTAESLTDVIDRRVAEKVADEKAQRLRDRDTLPPSKDHLQGLVYALLQQCRGDEHYGLVEVRQVPEPRSGPPSPYDLIVRRSDPDGREIRTGIVFLVTDQGNTAAAALRRLQTDPRPPERVLLVTDERHVPFGTRGRERLDDLDRRGAAAFRHLPLSFEDYAGLDALQTVVVLARAGDLDVQLPGGERRPLREEEVTDSHRRQGRYQAYPLLRELLGAAQPQTGAAKNHTAEVTDKDAREFIMAQVALADGVTLRELAERLLQRRGNGHGPGDLHRCLSRLQQVAADMGNEGLIQKTPDEQKLFLSSVRR